MALRGHAIGGNNAVESDRVATEGHPYNCFYTSNSYRGPYMSNDKFSKICMLNFVDCLQKSMVRWQTHTEHRGPTFKGE